MDPDYDGWELPGAGWDEPRMAALLASHDTIAEYVETVEPLLRKSATLELDGRRPPEDLAEQVTRLLGC